MNDILSVLLIRMIVESFCFCVCSSKWAFVIVLYYIYYFARNVFNCCSYFNTSTCNLWHLKLYNGSVDVHTLCKARMLLELLSVRPGESGFTSETIHNDPDTFIDFIAMVN